MKNAMMVMEMVMRGLCVEDSRVVKGAWLATKSAVDTYEEGYEEIVSRDTKRAKIAPPRSGSGQAARRPPCRSSIDPRKPGDKKTVRYASSMRWRANPATG